MNEPLLRIESIYKFFPVKRNKLFAARSAKVHALNGIDLHIGHEETLGLVGESGCGKSTLGRVVLMLIEPTAGDIFFHNNNIARLTPRKMRSLRKKMQIIYQDPYGSLNPRMKVGRILKEPIRLHGISKGRDIDNMVGDLLRSVGLPAECMSRFPHEFSGGQRQRIAIARALASNPELIVCDEPVSALDVSVQAQVINLLNSLKKKHHLSYLFISHDLMVVEHISDRVAVMYLGKIIECAPNHMLYGKAMHPYTKSLLSAVPVPDIHSKRNRELLKGEVPNPIRLPTGCFFHPRCPAVLPKCHKIEPALKQAEEGHFVACHLV